ncbi:MAG: (5-formylfuran-3-yl)methyl phosphate synthase [Promethearchaeota archaeon]
MYKDRINLLVSPRTIEEARILTNAPEVSYIDCKNPDEGSLGANFPWIIKGMKDLIPEGSSQLLSATIGDFPYLPGSASLAALGAATSGADIIKVGLKGPKNEKQGIHLMEKVVKAVKGYNENIKIVVAGYADRERLEGSPSYMEIPSIAANSGSDIAMLDTFIKDGKGLFDFLSLEDLMRFKEKAKSLNIDIALAGNIMSKDLALIKKIEPDIIGVRSVVCEEFNRAKSIKPELIDKLQIELYE